MALVAFSRAGQHDHLALKESRPAARESCRGNEGSNAGEEVSTRNLSPLWKLESHPSRHNVTLERARDLVET